MRFKKKKKKKLVIWFIIILIGIWYFKFASHHPHKIDLQAKDDFWGVTYSPKFAYELGLDWEETYLAMIDDIKVRNVRLPIYWDQIEVEEGQYDFSVYDYILDEGAKRDVEFVVNVGWRLPRWPECHTPQWAKGEDLDIIKAKSLSMIKLVVERYKDRPEIVAWQVENEPLLDWFGEGPEGDEDLLKQEVAFVKDMDDRPIIISASGELSGWHKEVEIADTFATTMYRVVWNPWFKYFRYPLPAWFYKLKLDLAGASPEQAIVSELQAEPWVPNGTLDNITFDEYDKSFSPEQFKANLQFAINVDFKQTYLWGIEWWYLQKEKGDTRYWDIARDIFARQ